VSGTTGRTPCGLDCNQSPGGLAFIDRCGTCVGGNTGKQACSKDCSNTWGGTAFIDSCGLCAGGVTGKSPILQPNLCHSISETTETIILLEIKVISPFQEELTVISTNPVEKIYLQSMMGNVVMESSLTFVNTSALPPGIYLLNIQTAQKLTNQRVVKY
ncbi:MAG: T9SS type A sorting domain-containing protein, partial [Cytophagales bacterium]|nr:T9SS type A sorting domain-containing protein [Cytophagales bacterium]